MQVVSLEASDRVTQNSLVLPDRLVQQYIAGSASFQPGLPPRLFPVSRRLMLSVLQLKQFGFPCGTLSEKP
ncbi:hypothetical protein [Streptomyces lydicus]|uniref:hypothetical protein n=1 Tax=Streptomyces lydicus TaxID=47763 RepID=UPI0028707D33|nr:hypothetical protein [Streptomyces lydicus]